MQHRLSRNGSLFAILPTQSEILPSWHCSFLKWFCPKVMFSSIASLLTFVDTYPCWLLVTGPWTSQQLLSPLASVDSCLSSQWDKDIPHFIRSYSNTPYICPLTCFLFFFFTAIEGSKVRYHPPLAMVGRKPGWGGMESERVGRNCELHIWFLISVVDASTYKPGHYWCHYWCHYCGRGISPSRHELH